jgi:hypothetical protein
VSVFVFCKEEGLWGKEKKLRKALSNPTLLAPFNEEDGILHLIIETPKGHPEQVRLR